MKIDICRKINSHVNILFRIESHVCEGVGALRLLLALSTVLLVGCCKIYLQKFLGHRYLRYSILGSD